MNCEATRYCPSPPTSHWIWPADQGERIMYLLCDQAQPWFASNWAPPEFTHEPEPACGHPRAVFSPAENRCVLVDDDGLIAELESFLRHPTSIGAT